ncbi:MAG: MerR family transcriptional regulator [Acidobacteriota bacterium]
MQTAVAIPDKLFFKIGEVCELVGVPAHVLRYWETEFPSLQPQKNRAGQRTYRRKDVEMALRIRELLYDERFTIAGARLRLQSEGRGAASKLKVVPPNAKPAEMAVGIAEFDESIEVLPGSLPTRPMSRDAVERLRLMAEDLLTTLNRDV